MTLASQNLRGAAWMTAGMALFAVGDALVKTLGAQIGAAGVMVFITAALSVVFVTVARLRGQRVQLSGFFRPWVLARSLGEAVATACVLSALVLGSMSSFTAIAQLLPLSVTAAAALLLREPVGWRRWSAIAAGLAGTLLIVRPAPGSFDLAAGLAVLGVLGMTARDIGARMAPRTVSTEMLGLYASLFTFPFALFWMLAEPAPLTAWTTGPVMAGLAALAGVVAAAYLFSTNAMRVGEVGAIAPFRYTRLIFGLTLGIMVFGETPDLATLTGAAIILAAGLYAWMRERRVKSPLSAPAA